MSKTSHFYSRKSSIWAAGFQKILRKFFRGTEKLWKSFLKPGLSIATPILSAGVAAKTKNHHSAQITNSILKSSTGGKNLSLADLPSSGLRLQVM